MHPLHLFLRLVPRVRLAFRVAALAAVILSRPALADRPPRAEPPAAVGHWEGEIRFRGDVWPIRLDVEARGDSASATLDLPEVGMAWEPAAIDARGDSVVLELPFGLGRVRGTASGTGLSAARVLSGGDTILLALRRTPPLAVVRQDVRFRSGPATLAGVLMMPAGAGPHPAVVLVHGSGAAGRDSWGYRSAADFLVRAGYAVLYYDKRGYGESTGDWMQSTFPDITDLADDVVAAAAFLEARPEVDPARIGVMGGSQALWVSALAASRRADAVDFMIMRGAPAVTPARQELQRVAASLRVEGHDSAAVAQALEHTRLYLAVVESGRGWDALRPSVERVRQRPWAEQVLQADTEDDLYWWRRNHAIDPAPLLRGLRVPVLLLYGEADAVVPPAENLPLMRALLAGTDLTVATFPRANHSVETPAGPDEAGRFRFPRRAPGYFSTIESWLAQHVRP